MSVCDIACGMAAHSAVLEALIARGITGEGAKLEVSLFDGMADWMNVPLLYFEGTGRAPQRVGLAHPSICPYGAFPTRDGALVLLSIQNEREWVKFCAAFLRQPDLPSRAGFESNTAGWRTGRGRCRGGERLRGVEPRRGRGIGCARPARPTASSTGSPTSSRIRRSAG